VGVLNWNTCVETKGAYANAQTALLGTSLISRLLSSVLGVRRFYIPRSRVQFVAPGGWLPTHAGTAESEIAQIGGHTLILTPEQSSVERLQQFPTTSRVNIGNSPTEVAF
jgi:hypothetical protein